MTSLMRRPGSGPVTLTAGQFRGTAAGQKPGASYEGYLAYINRRRAAKLGQQNADPLGQTGPGDIQSTVDRFTGMYGAPQTDQQIQTSAQGLIDPILAAVTGHITDQAKTASGAIGANSAALAKQLGGVDYAAPYQGAKLEQAAVDAALREGLAGGGAQLAGDLRARLGQIGDPTVAAAADQVAGQGVAAGNTELARGSSNLGALIAQAAAAKSYGQKLPGIAQLTGLQDIAGVQRDATSQIGSQTADISKLLPSIVQNFRSERSNQQGNRASLAAQLYGMITGQNVTKATAKAGLQTDATKLEAASTPMPDPSLSRAYGYAVDQYGNPVGGTQRPLPGYHVDPQSGNVVKDAKPAKPQGPSSATREHALKAIDTYYWGVPSKTRQDGSVIAAEVPGVDYPTAVANLMNGFGFTKQQAETLANTRYKPGEDGRPMSAKQKAARAPMTPAQRSATDAALHPVAALTGGR